eukprot:6937438-Prorocentrum_lima.AAC.1
MGDVSTLARVAKLVAALPRQVRADTSALLMHQLHYLVEVGTASMLADAAGAVPLGVEHEYMYKADRQHNSAGR